MYKTIEEYLDALKNEMKGGDAALVQDALADAREHLSNALGAAREKTPEVADADALAIIVEEYGSPEETASAYREVERRTSPALKQTVKPRSPSGILWCVSRPARLGCPAVHVHRLRHRHFLFHLGGDRPLALHFVVIFIFGLPLALLFLLSVRGLALLEGRLVEALLGVRMPRRPLFSHQGMKWFERLKALVTDKATWLMLVYMILQFVLGTIYFIVIVMVLSISLSFIAIPVLQEVLGQGVVMFNSRVYYTFATWTYPLWILGGFLLWTAFMNIARGVGQLHGDSPSGCWSASSPSSSRTQKGRRLARLPFLCLVQMS